MDIRDRLAGYTPASQEKIKGIAITLAIKQSAKEISFRSDDELVEEAIRIYNDIVLKFFN